MIAELIRFPMEKRVAEASEAAAMVKRILAQQVRLKEQQNHPDLKKKGWPTLGFLSCR